MGRTQPRASAPLNHAAPRRKPRRYIREAGFEQGTCGKKHETID
jgi:hypothetical protein